MISKLLKKHQTIQLETKKQMKSTQTLAVWVLFFCVFLMRKVAQKTARVIAELLLKIKKSLLQLLRRRD
jgi:uncharacterized protein YggT (Ycf19 family)